MRAGNSGSEAFRGPHMGQTLQIPTSEKRDFPQKCKGISGFKF
jgi:hypothetical protein